MFRAFSAAQGFAVERIALMEAQFPGIELVPRRGLYDVNDPAELGSRVGLVSRHPVMLLVHARKLTHLSGPLRVAPQQIDYVELWRGGQSHRERAFSSLRQKVPPNLARRIHGYRQRMRSSLRNRRFYTKVR